MGSSVTRYPCKRAACPDPLPELAVRSGDGYCSRICAELDAGILTEEDVAVHRARREAGLAGSDAGWRLSSAAKYQRMHGAGADA